MFKYFKTFNRELYIPDESFLLVFVLSSWRIFSFYLLPVLITRNINFDYYIILEPVEYTFCLNFARNIFQIRYYKVIRIIPKNDVCGTIILLSDSPDFNANVINRIEIKYFEIL